MIFETLYKLEGNWRGDHKSHPKNHLSIPNEGYKPLCNINLVQGMGGSVEYSNGKWYQNNPVTDKYDIEVTAEDCGICKNCIKKIPTK